MRKFILGIISILFICCAAFGAISLSACSGNSGGGGGSGHSNLAEYAAYTQDIDYRFAITGDKDSPNGNINESRLYADYDMATGSTYYVVLDLKFYNFNWAGEGFAINAMISNPQGLTVTLHEANTSDYDEQTDGDFYTITTRYKVPQNRGEEKSYRVVYEVVAGDSGFAANMEVDGLGLSPTYSAGYVMKFALNDDRSSYTIMGPSSSDKFKERVYTIPDHYGAFPVTAIGESAFERCTYLESLTIPSCITEIKKDAFEECSYFENIYVAELADWCKIKFEDGLNCNPLYYSRYSGTKSKNLYIGGELLTSLHLTSGPEKIGDYTFFGYDKLKSVVIEGGVKSIGKEAFSGCVNIESITISDCVTSIGKGAFKSCSGLESATLAYVGDGAENTKFAYIFNAEDGSDNYTAPASLKTVTITGGDKLDEMAFYGCNYVESVTLPASLTSVGVRAFYFCQALKSVDFGDNSNLLTIGEMAFESCLKLQSVNFGKNSKLETIDDFAFDTCRAISDITLPASLTKIGGRVFDGCTGLRNIVIPQNVTELGDGAFADCTLLSNVDFGEDSKCEIIGVSCFYGCTALEEFTVPKNIRFILRQAFRNCKNLKNVTFESTAVWERSRSGDSDYQALDVTDTALNAENLKNTYSDYYWRHS